MFKVKYSQVHLGVSAVVIMVPLPLLLMPQELQSITLMELQLNVLSLPQLLLLPIVTLIRKFLQIFINARLALVHIY
jgi:hypothetical protein